MNKKTEAAENWEIFGDSALITLINVITMVGTLLILLSMAIFLLWAQFQAGFDQGFRSLAGLLLPWIIITFLYKTINPQEWTTEITGIGLFIVFVISGIIGFLIVPGMIVISTILSPGVPVREVIISGVLSIMLYGRLNTIFYGVFSGLLLFLILRGFPPEVFDFGPTLEQLLGGGR